MRYFSGSETLRPEWRVFCVAGLVFLSSAACAGAPRDGDEEPLSADAVDPSSRNLQIAGQTPLNGASLRVDQIGDAAFSVATTQIDPGKALPGLTIAQLRAYVDRCAPGAKKPLPSANCSELRLMFSRSMRSDDEIAGALAVLDRLGLPESDGLVARLEKGDLRGLDAQAVASGLLEPTPTPEPENSEEDNGLGSGVEGLGGAIGIIVQTPGE